MSHITWRRARGGEQRDFADRASVLRNRAADVRCQMAARHGVDLHVHAPAHSGATRRREAVRDIDSGTITYYVQWPEKRTEVHVVHTTPPYLRTDRDGTTRNLDDLPSF